MLICRSREGVLALEARGPRLEVPAPSPQRSLSRRKSGLSGPEGPQNECSWYASLSSAGSCPQSWSRGSSGAAVRISICEGPSLSSPAHMFHRAPMKIQRSPSNFSLAVEILRATCDSSSFQWASFGFSAALRFF